MSSQDEKPPDDFQTRLKAARSEFKEMEKQSGAVMHTAPDDSAIRSGRAGSELLASVFAAAFLGYLIDWLFQTTPWGLIFMMILGFVSGVMRANAAMRKNNQKKP